MLIHVVLVLQFPKSLKKLFLVLYANSFACVRDSELVKAILLVVTITIFRDFLLSFPLLYHRGTKLRVDFNGHLLLLFKWDCYRAFCYKLQCVAEKVKQDLIKTFRISKYQLRNRFADIDDKVDLLCLDFIFHHLDNLMEGISNVKQIHMKLKFVKLESSEVLYPLSLEFYQDIFNQT